MRVVIAASDSAAAEWLAKVLGEGGFTVVLLPDPSPGAPDLNVADLLIVDNDAARAVGDVSVVPRLLLASRGGTIEIDAVKDGFDDIIVVPSEPHEVVARVQYALESTRN